MAGVSAAIDMQCLTGDEVCCFAVKHSVDDVLDRAHATHGMQCREEAMRFGIVHRSLDDAG